MSPDVLAEAILSTDAAGFIHSIPPILPPCDGQRAVLSHACAGDRWAWACSLSCPCWSRSPAQGRLSGSHSPGSAFRREKSAAGWPVTTRVFVVVQHTNTGCCFDLNSGASRDHPAWEYERCVGQFSRLLARDSTGDVGITQGLDWPGRPVMVPDLPTRPLWYQTSREQRCCVTACTPKPGRVVLGAPP